MRMSARIFDGIVWEVIDGDSVNVLVDLDAFEEWKLVHFRLAGCNAREESQPGGPEAKANLTALLPAGTKVGITSIKYDKFSPRYDAIITLPDGRDLVTVLVDEQWAASWDGKGTRPLPPWPRTVG